MRHGRTCMLMLLMAACCVGPSHSRSVAVSPRASPTLAPVASRSGRHLSPCVLHAGEVHTEEHRERGPGGVPGPATRRTACYVNAECDRQKGVTTPGDALLEVECDGSRCVCRVELLGGNSVKREQSFEAECETGDQADQLIKQRCIPWAEGIVAQ